MASQTAEPDEEKSARNQLLDESNASLEILDLAMYQLGVQSRHLVDRVDDESFRL